MSNYYQRFTWIPGLGSTKKKPGKNEKYLTHCQQVNSDEDLTKVTHTHTHAHNLHKYNRIIII